MTRGILFKFSLRRHRASGRELFYFCKCSNTFGKLNIFQFWIWSTLLGISFCLMGVFRVFSISVLIEQRNEKYNKNENKTKKKVKQWLRKKKNSTKFRRLLLNIFRCTFNFSCCCLNLFQKVFVCLVTFLCCWVRQRYMGMKKISLFIVKQRLF